MNFIKFPFIKEKISRGVTKKQVLYFEGNDLADLSKSFQPRETRELGDISL